MLLLIKLFYIRLVIFASWVTGYSEMALTKRMPNSETQTLILSEWISLLNVDVKNGKYIFLNYVEK